MLRRKTKKFTQSVINRVGLVCALACYVYGWARLTRDQRAPAVQFVTRTPVSPDQFGTDVHNLNVVTISASSSACTPGISKGNEWCVPPVLGTPNSPKCKYKRWRDLVEHLGGDEAYNVYRRQFEVGGRIGLQQNATTMFAIYSAHLNALQQLCARRYSSPYGIVLEGDIDDSSPLQSFRPQSFGAVMSKLSDVSVFNFGPTTPICRDEHRFKAYLRGECFASHRLGSWGAVAVGYNLSTSCSEHFLRMQDALKACVPSDLGLYSGAGGYHVVDSVLSMFAVRNNKASSNGADDIHAKLGATYSENLLLWKEFRREGIDCESMPFSRSAGFNESQRYRCNLHSRLVFDIHNLG